MGLIKRTKEQIELDKENYATHCLQKALQYEADVLADKIVVSRWIKKSVIREQVLRSKYKYDEEKVKDVFKFFYFIFLKKNERFNPLPFQTWLVLSIYSLYRENGKRLRKYGIIWVARKNAKTTFTSILSLYELTKGANEAEVYFLATTAKQASQALKYLKAIIAVSPALRKRVDVLEYHLRYNKFNIARPLASNANNLDGLNPSFAIIDESHAHPNRDLFNIMDSGMKARDNPLLLEISTAGNRKDYPFYNQLEIAKKVLEGELVQDNTFYALYTLDEESEIEQPEMWIKSNPSMGVIIDLETLIEDFEKSKKVQADMNSFIIKNLNYYKEHLQTWIEDDYYKLCFKDFNMKDLKGCKAYMGLDLASTRDLAALVIIIEKEGKLFVKSEHFLPQNKNSIVRMNGLDLTDWIKKGFITQTEKPSIDYDFIAERIAYYSEYFKVVSLGYDKWNSSQIIPELQVNLALYCVQCPQNTSFFNMPLRFVEKFIMDKEITLGRNPVLRWMFRNVILYTDGNGNIKVMKNKSKDSVDGVVALGMAMGMYLKDKQYEF